MSSVVIAGDTSGTVTIAAPAVAGTPTLTLPTTSGTILTSGTAVTVAQGGTGNATATAYAVQCGGTTSTGAHQSIASVGTSGQVLTSNGASALPTFQTISSGGMTLLGTITISGGNSVSLGSLTLTSYKALFISFINFDTNGVRSYISSSNVQTGGGMSIPSAMAGSPVYGTAWLDLASGSVGGAASDPNVGSNYTRFGFAGGFTNVSTSTTTIYFRCEGTTSYNGGGSIKIYGVA
jgi:hypothetical protein